jgi:hypothetical protein
MNGPLLHSKGCVWADYEELGLRKNSTRNSKACKVYGIYTTMEFLLVGGVSSRIRCYMLLRAPGCSVTPWQIQARGDKCHCSSSVWSE